MDPPEVESIWVLYEIMCVWKTAFDYFKSNKAGEQQFLLIHDGNCQVVLFTKIHIERMCKDPYPTDSETLREINLYKYVNGAINELRRSTKDPSTALNLEDWSLENIKSELMRYTIYIFLGIFDTDDKREKNPIHVQNFLKHFNPLKQQQKKFDSMLLTMQNMADCIRLEYIKYEKSTTSVGTVHEKPAQRVDMPASSERADGREYMQIREDDGQDTTLKLFDRESIAIISTWVQDISTKPNDNPNDNIEMLLRHIDDGCGIPIWLILQFGRQHPFLLVSPISKVFVKIEALLTKMKLYTQQFKEWCRNPRTDTTPDFLNEIWGQEWPAPHDRCIKGPGGIVSFSGTHADLNIAERGLYLLEDAIGLETNPSTKTNLQYSVESLYEFILRTKMCLFYCRIPRTVGPVESALGLMLLGRTRDRTPWDALDAYADVYTVNPDLRCVYEFYGAVRHAMDSESRVLPDNIADLADAMVNAVILKEIPKIMPVTTTKKPPVPVPMDLVQFVMSVLRR